MKQILHIFAKDVRRFWPEIVISLAITSALVWIYPHQWLQIDDTGLSFAEARMAHANLQRLASVLVFLVPVSWWILVTRLIHEERLVGDRQFWLTRPYEWKKLLAAKMLFLILFLYLPLFTAQCLLQRSAGLDPFSSIPVLLFNLLLLTTVFILPLVVLATITSSFARMTLTILGILLCIVIVVSLLSNFSSGYNGFEAPNPYHIPLIFSLGLFGAAIVVQYATRLAWLSRLLLIAFPVLFVCIPDPSSIDKVYPRPVSAADAPVQLSYSNNPLRQPVAHAAHHAKEIGVDIPIQHTEIEDGYVIIPDAVQVRLEASNGVRWSSEWKTIFMTPYVHGNTDTTTYFDMPRAIYEKLKSLPLHVYITYALTQGQAGNATSISLPKSDFSVHNFGTCTPLTGMTPSFDQITGIVCRFPRNPPALASVHVLRSRTPCTAQSTDPRQGVQDTGWTGAVDAQSDLPSITSVWELGIRFSSDFATNDESGMRQKPRFLCPGTPITFTQYHRIRRTQAALSIEDFHLPEQRDTVR